MRSIKLLLNEDVYSPNTVFVDSATGKQYKWTGDKFVQIKPKKGKPGGEKGKGVSRNIGNKHAAKQKQNKSKSIANQQQIKSKSKAI